MQPVAYRCLSPNITKAYIFDIHRKHQMGQKTNTEYNLYGETWWWKNSTVGMLFIAF